MTGGSGGLGGIFPLLQSLTAAEIARAFGESSGFSDLRGAPLGANRLNGQGSADGHTQGGGDAPGDRAPSDRPRNAPNTPTGQQGLTQAQAQAFSQAGGMGQAGANGAAALQGGAVFGADLDLGLSPLFGDAASLGLGLGAGGAGRETPWSNWLMGLAAPMSALGKGAALLADGQLQQAARRGGDAGVSSSTTQSAVVTQGAVVQGGNSASNLGAALMIAAIGAEGAAAADTQDDAGAAQTAARAAAGRAGGGAEAKSVVQPSFTQVLLSAVEIQALADGAEVLPQTTTNGPSLADGQAKAQVSAQASTAPQAALTGQGQSPQSLRETVPNAALLRDSSALAETRSTGTQGVLQGAPQAQDAAAPARAAIPDLPAGAGIRAALSVALGEIAGATGFPLTPDSKGGGAAAMVIFNAAMIPQWPPAFKAQGAMAETAALQVAGAQLAQMSPEEAAEYLAKMANAFGFLLTVKKRLSKTLKEEKESILGMFSFLGVALDTLVKGLQTALDLTIEQQAMLEEVLTEGKPRGSKSRQRLHL